MVVVGKEAPDFTLPGIYRGHITDYSLKSYRGKWLVLFFYPADFTFICPTEVVGFSKVAISAPRRRRSLASASIPCWSAHPPRPLLHPG